MKILHYKLDNYNINILPTKKFKTNRLEIAFSNDLVEETATSRALLPYILKATTKKYASRQILQTHLENLYSAGFSASIKKMGLTQTITFDLSLINNKYTMNQENLFLEGLHFLKEVLFSPNFTPEIFKEEQRLLKEYFDGIYANKMRYAVKQTLHAMYQGEAFDVDAHGDQEKLMKLSLEDVKASYNDMMKNDHISINIVGDIDPEEVVAQIKDILPFEDRKKDLKLIDDIEKPKRTAQELFESQDIKQGKLCIGYQFPIYYDTEDYHKAIVFNAVLGSGPDSLLFRRIREELSLVYFIGSLFDYHKGSMLIYAGINQSEYQNVINEIDQTIDDLKTMNYVDTQLEIAKKNIISSLKQSLDSQGSLVTRINNLSLFNKTFDQEQLTKKIESVTKQDLADLTLKLKKDVSFLLRNDELEKN